MKQEMLAFLLQFLATYNGKNKNKKKTMAGVQGCSSIGKYVPSKIQREKLNLP